MQTLDARSGAHEIPEYGLRNLKQIHRNLNAPALIEKALERGEGSLATNGALVVRTGMFTGRSPKDKYVVRDSLTESTVNWGAVNQPMHDKQFSALYSRLVAYLEGQEVFVQDCFAGADAEYTLPVRVITQKAWHALFARQLFLRPTAEALAAHTPQFTILFAPELRSIPAEDGTRSETCIAIHFKRRIVLIAGTMYAGEMKKSIFTILNYLLPDRGVMPMHCSANSGHDGNVALFFGLSGTGKTTLSADPTRYLIGDDEHGWSSRGVFNFEGGCYAKCIRLSQKNEPQIWNAIRFGTVLENVAMDAATRALDFASDDLTENTRAAYPVDYIDGALIPGLGGHPNTILFLTADAFGVLPPISRLSPEQAMYHFLSGYTSKLAGTERGLGKEPVPNFSTCFGEPFLPRKPQVYAEMLGEKMRRHNVACWLVNTGWAGGPHGVGQRMKLEYTRAMVDAAIEGELDAVEKRAHPVFGGEVPLNCPGVPPEMLDARGMWSDAAAYDQAANALAARFAENFRRFPDVPQAIVVAGPKQI